MRAVLYSSENERGVIGVLPYTLPDRMTYVRLQKHQNTELPLLLSAQPDDIMDTISHTNLADPKTRGKQLYDLISIICILGTAVLVFYMYKGRAWASSEKVSED